MKQNETEPTDGPNASEVANPHGFPERIEGGNFLVVGGSSGIGAAVAAALKERGAQVDVLDRAMPADPDPALNFHTVDVRDAASVQTTVDSILSSRGTIDGLVYAAGVLDGYATLAEITPELMNVVMDVNAFGALRALQALAPSMKERGYGRVVLFGSIAGSVAGAGGIAYTMSKHAVAGLTKHLALELSSYGITTNSVAPGSISGTKIRSSITEIVGEENVVQNPGLGTMTPEEALQQYPVGRLGSVDAVVPTVLHLLEPSSWFISGTTSVVDGGYTAK